MNYLIFPPFCDPTQSYPSLPILKGFLKKNNVEVTICDYNIEGHLDLISKSKYKFLIDVFRQRELFDQQDLYESAKNALNAFYDDLSRSSKKYKFSNNAHFDLEGPWNYKRLKRYCQKECSPFHDFYLNKIAKLQNVEWLGISCTFVSQLPEVFYIAHLVKKIYPTVKTFVGGPCIAQIVEAVPDNLQKIFNYFDLICYDEGEITLTKLFSSESIDQIPNIIYLSKENKIVKNKRRKLLAHEYELPDYEGFDLDSYLSPSRTILYTPSRGCYWNRCSFCHYGFNQVDGVGYREVCARRAVDDLKYLKDKYGVSNFYFSSDVLSPKFARTFSELAIKENLDIKWSTDLRIEKNYTPELCELLFQAGLVSVAFGIESGSNHVLQMIDKGTTQERIREVNKNFFNAGVATCWMTFNYHPQESLEEAIETINLIKENRNKISLYIIGEFGLTVGSRIFDFPDKYGLTDIMFRPDDEFKIYPYFEQLNNFDLSVDYSDVVDRKVSRLDKYFNLAPYPFKGAISTHHSFLTFIEKGNRAFWTKANHE